MKQSIIRITRNQSGAANLILPIFAIAVIGILSFILIAALGPFHNSQLQSMYPKPPTEAARGGNGGGGKHGKPTPSPKPANGVVLSITPTTSSIDCPSFPCSFMTNEGLIMSTGTQKVSAAEIHLTFNPSVVHMTNLTAGSALPVVLTGVKIDNVAGTASIVVGAQPTSPFMGTGTLATVSFAGANYGTSAVNYATTTQTASIGMTGNSLTGTSGANISVVTVAPTAIP